MGITTIKENDDIVTFQTNNPLLEQMNGEDSNLTLLSLSKSSFYKKHRKQATNLSVYKMEGKINKNKDIVLPMDTFQQSMNAINELTENVHAQIAKPMNMQTTKRKYNRNNSEQK